MKITWDQTCSNFGWFQKEESWGGQILSQIRVTIPKDGAEPLFPFLLCLNTKPSSLSESGRHIWDSLLYSLQCGSIKFPLSALDPCRGRELRKGCWRVQAGASALRLQLHFSVSGSSEPLLPEERRMRVEGKTRLWFLERSQAQNQIINDCLYSPR